MATLFFAEFNANRDFFFPGSMTGRGPVRIPFDDDEDDDERTRRPDTLWFFADSTTFALVLGNFCPSRIVKEKVIKMSF